MFSLACCTAAICPSPSNPGRRGRAFGQYSCARPVLFNVRVNRRARVSATTGDSRRRNASHPRTKHASDGTDGKDPENSRDGVGHTDDSQQRATEEGADAEPPTLWELLCGRIATGLLSFDQLRKEMGTKAIAYATMVLLAATTGIAPAIASLPPPNPQAAMLSSVASRVPIAFVETAELTAPSRETAAEMLRATDELSPDERSTIGLFERCKSSVVNITNVGTRRNNVTMDMEQVPRGTGSGFVWDKKGHIVTNFYVVQGATDLRVALIDQSVYSAKVVSTEPEKDVAVLELDAPPDVIRNMTPVVLGKSSNLQVGQSVFAIGNPFGLDHTLTSGIISGLGREIGGPRGLPIRGVIQTDAAINPGNSGGVLLDSRGRLIGINTAIADPTGSGSNSGVGFAIPIDTAQGLVDQILQYGQVLRPGLGVTIAPSQLTRQLGTDGVLILDVRPGGPAAKAGLKPTYRDEYGRVVLGDIIVELNGAGVRNELDLFQALDGCRVGDTVELKVMRSGSTVKTVKITVANRESLQGQE